jgi:hypothetical protein
MASYSYRISVKTAKGIKVAKFKSPERLEVGEEIILSYNGKSNLVKITLVPKSGPGNYEAEEI